MAVTLAILASRHGPRTDSPEEGLGVLMIVGIIVLVFVVAGLALRFLVPKLRGNRVASPNEDETHDSGRAGRIL